MKYITAIGIGTALVMLFPMIAWGGEAVRSADNEQMAAATSYVEIKCDPCDYNIDYGDIEHLGRRMGVDEGAAKLECDTCDYNIDYGTSHPDKK